MNLLEAKELLEENGYEVIVEDVETITMRNISKKDLDLPANIWIDDSRAYKRSNHTKRIKFQFDGSNKFMSNELIPMKFDGIIPIENYTTKLSKRNIEKISQWVINNKEALELLADGIISYDDISPYLIKGGEQATTQQKDRLLKAIKKLTER